IRFPIRKLEHVWHLFAVLVFSGAFLILWRYKTIQNQITYQGDPVLRYILVFTYLVSFVFLILRIPKYKFVKIFRHKLLWTLIGFVFLSSLWSSVPEITFRKAIAVLFSTIYGILLAIRYPLSKVTRIFII